MLKDNNVITFQDKKKKNNVECEINIPGQYRDVIRMKIGENESYIKIKDFYGVVLMLVKGNQLDSIIPDKERKVKKYKRQFKMIAKKDIKKGEEIICTYEVDIPRVITDNYEQTNNKN